MKTILVSGNDTGVGKTWVVRALAERFASAGLRVQVVKPVETGVSPDDSGDADFATASRNSRLSAHRFVAYPDPLAPLTAAKRVGETFCFDRLLSHFDKLDTCEVRLVEGAGGLAVPLDEDGRDWADLALALEATLVVLVVQDRLGAINQARLLESYAHTRGLNACFWLNACAPVEPLVAESNRDAISRLHFPLLARQTFDTPQAQYDETHAANLLSA